MKFFIVFICVKMAAALRQEFTFEDIIHEEWKDFKMQYQKSYSSNAEDRHHMGIYALNKYKIAKHNEMYEKRMCSFKLKVNKYSDMMESEFDQKMKGFVYHYDPNSANHTMRYRPRLADYPTTMDWRQRGVVTDVKDQKQCGSCWAFSATGALEGQTAIKSKRLVSLSEQNLVDCCTTKYGNSGCNGGWMNSAFQYVNDNGGINTEASYPYQAAQGQCRYNNSGGVAATATGYVIIPQGDEKKLMDAVVSIGPISVAIDAPNTLQQYAEGVYYEPGCSTKSLIHAVLVVGYGTDPQGGDYWLAKNSWGKSWGLDGYIKMARNRNNHCGIASLASYPTV